MAAVGRELGFRKTGSCSLREETARVTLNRIRHQGHPYVELREDGKRFIFFCTLCLAPCYSDTVLYDHLNGNLHKQRYAAAKVTLFGPNPWPFDDGVFFFCTLPEKEQVSAVSSSQRDRVVNSNDGNLGIVINHSCFKASKAKDNGIGVNGSETYGNLNPDDSNSALVLNGYDKISSPIDNYRHLVIPGVLLNDEVSILAVRSIGYGQIGSRIRGTNEMSNMISRMWCAWLGEGDSCERSIAAPDCDFSIITFSYTYDLGRKPVGSDLSLPPPSPHLELESTGSNAKKRKESFSEPEDMHEATGDHCGSTEEDCLALNDSTENALVLQKDSAANALTSDQYNNQLQHSRFISSKAVRRELRRQQRLAAERMCDVCQQRMLPGKDVATLLNRKTGNLACSSRNTNGAFHVFHTSCLIHWVLLCEFEILMDKSSNAENPQGSAPAKSRRKRAARSSKMKMIDSRMEVRKPHISSVFCPECQGTGVNIEGDQLEKPTIPLSEMFLYKIKALESHKAWMKNPECLQDCSTGLHFPSSSEESFQEQVLPLKKLHFYQALDRP
ncbi:Acyl-acyl-carrier-protein--UDP-N-acetylglucosamine O-acyltransferase [Cinnamomum micranthum f. kanehirae]|uniref:Acyl-acyl-carrier-protein--UDP-N-acetylglucosamine O-acyltransferase n=1 Tax=Cinnamomum micranthum f. kanehirae TaxID=337451 RepID=A0A443P740_9MAGN|nr:Acyl-acyl-carrier-protein--UDP-N-acetylglucosamine O-acyltransferase [Cinnamomum micranthum f. kanehirae]